MSAVSVHLAHLRVARGLTQQQLAERTGLRRDTISALERGKSQAIEFDTLARLCDALDVQASDILALAPTAHVAPILGGEDEDAIIEARLAEAEAEIDALIADPARAAQALTIENDALEDNASSRMRTPAARWAGLIDHLKETSRSAINHLEVAAKDNDTATLHEDWNRHDLAKSAKLFQEGSLIGIVAMRNGELVAVPIAAEDWQVMLTGAQR